MYHGRDTGAYELPQDQLAHFIAARTEMMRVGDSTPININLADGQVLRFSCTALPDGGRMLSYTPVTDLVRYSDAPGNAEYFRSLAEPAPPFPTSAAGMDARPHLVGAARRRNRRCGPQIAGLLLNETADQQPPSNAILIFPFGGSRRTT